MITTKAPEGWTCRVKPCWVKVPLSSIFSMEEKTTCHSVSLQIQWLPSCTSQVEDDLLSHTLPTVPLDCHKLSMRSHPVPWARGSPVEKRCPESLPKRHLCHSAVQTLQSRRSEVRHGQTPMQKELPFFKHWSVDWEGSECPEAEIWMKTVSISS